MSEPLVHKVAFITGAASGIGRATALSLAAAGAKVAAVDRDAPGAAHTVAMATETGLAATAFTADLANIDAIPSVVDGVLAEIGRIDILVNCAGVSGVTGATQRVTEFADETFAAVMTINLHAPFALTREVARHMVDRGEGGRIVNVSSSAAFQGLGVPAAYAASKAGINALTRVSAAELAPHGINVNAVAPGITRTPIIGEGLEDADYDALVGSGPHENFTHRAADPDEVAAVIRFLCLEESAQITGQVIHTSAGGIV